MGRGSLYELKKRRITAKNTKNRESASMVIENIDDRINSDEKREKLMKRGYQCNGSRLGGRTFNRMRGLEDRSKKSQQKQ